MPATGSPARCCRASGVVAPLYGEKDVKTSPPCREGSLQEKVSLLPGREWRTREGLSCWTGPWSAWRGDPTGILRSLPRGAHGRRTVEALCGGLAEGIITTPEAVMILDRLVKSHQCSAPDGAKGQLVA
jgi:hypothetical protein